MFQWTVWAIRSRRICCDEMYNMVELLPQRAFGLVLGVGLRNNGRRSVLEIMVTIVTNAAS